jgi:mRNA-degrading endonuclease RelE of RelBE toxin-antitoxin system
MANKIRKDVDLTPKTIKKLQKLADDDKRKLKPYMEKVLEDHSESANDYKFTIGKV